MMPRLAALLAGLILAGLPYLVYGTSSHSHAPHADHAPRHGGDLFMLGDYHVEVVRRPQRIEVFLSDSVRKPQRPERGSLELLGGGKVPMRWEDQRLVANVEDPGRIERYELHTRDGARLELAAF
jgi:hypothetical protein